MLEKLNKYNVNIFIPKNNSLFISILFVFILFATIIYLSPQVFLFLFKSILGNLFLLGLVGIVGYFDVRWAIGLSAIFVILYQASHIATSTSTSTSTSSSSSSNTNNIEGFGQGTEGDTIYKPTTWSQQMINDFLKFEKTFHPNFTFDINILQQQATPDEVEYLLENNKWPWSDDIIKMYKDAIAQSSFISTNLNSSLYDAQAIYNEAAIKELLSWNSKEGTFLLNGVNIGNSKNMPANVNNIIKCASSKSGVGTPGTTGNGTTDPISMQKIVYTGYDSINGSLQSQVTDIKNSDLPSLITGFQFLKGECNPCTALQNPPNYSCPFSINTGNGADVSPIWQNLWSISGSESQPASADSSDTKQFPLLNQLKKEISRATFVSMNPTTSAAVTDSDSGSSGNGSNNGDATTNTTTTKKGSKMTMGAAMGTSMASKIAPTNNSTLNFKMGNFEDSNRPTNGSTLTNINSNNPNIPPLDANGARNYEPTNMF